MLYVFKGSCLLIVIKNDGLDEWIEGILLNCEWDKLNVEEIWNIIKDVGIVGMGGVIFLIYIKLNLSKDKKIDVCIVNVVECELYLIVDYRMMFEYVDCIVIGVKIIMKVFGVIKVFIGIEDNKMDVVKVMKDVFKDMLVEVVFLFIKYL